MQGHCSDCGGPVSRPETRLCHKCFVKKRRQNMPRPHPCLECGKEVTRYAIRCPSCAHSGIHPSIEARKKMSITRTGLRHTPESIEKMRGIKKLYFKTHPHPCKGRKHSAEEIERRRKALVGKPLSPERKKNISIAVKRFFKTSLGKRVYEKIRLAHVGLHPSQETLDKMSVAHSGERNANYVHGMARFPYPADFSLMLKRQIRKRDNYACQICGMVENGYRLHPHHIDYDKNNNDPKNLICLCRTCHTKTNYNRSSWIEYFRPMDKRE